MKRFQRERKAPLNGAFLFSPQDRRLEQLPKLISEKVGDDLRVVAANRQVCPTISEITFGNLYKLESEPHSPDEGRPWPRTE